MLLSSLSISRERAMVCRWKDEAERCRYLWEQRQKVLTAVAAGSDTITEIHCETGIARSTCNKILKRLSSENLITRRSVRNANNRMELRFEIIVKK